MTNPVQLGFSDVSEEYAKFVEKFKPKKTTDDCYTPENVFNAVAEWAASRYGFDKSAIVRPFWPGADYRRKQYPPECVVLDNPPFSILNKIIRFYIENGIRFFLFSPALTLFTAANIPGVQFISSGSSITYANGAEVNTAFVTNLGDHEIVAEACPDLHRIIKTANAINLKVQKKQLRNLQYPDAIITAARMNYFAVHNTPFQIRRKDAIFVRDIDNNGGKGIFGGAFMLSERAAAERAAAERAAAERAAAERAAAERATAERITLSTRELELQTLIDKQTSTPSTSGDTEK